MKKFKREMLLATGLLLSAVTVAQQGELKKFPDFRVNAAMESLNLEGEEFPEKVSPNADKEKGFVMYATTLNDYFKKERGWYTMRSYDTGNATKLKTWNPGSQSYVYGLRCGSWGGDDYYAYYVMEYDLGFDYPDSFVKVDIETGDTTVVRKFSEGDEFYDNWHDYYLYYMTYNPVKDVIYALGATTFSDGTQGASIYTVDKETGIPTKLKDFDFISFAAAVDMKGDLWIHQSIYDDNGYVGCKLACMDTDDFSVKSEVMLTHYTRPFKTMFYGTMSFNYTTGELFWAATDEYNSQSFYRLDKETGALETLGALWGNFVGLYIPYVLPDKPDAPSAVVDLTATPDMTGKLKSTLRWKNPETQWNEEELTKLAEILIYKKGIEDPVATLATTSQNIGQEMEWTDENAVSGINTYYVTPCSEVGVKGITDSINVFVGEDLPGPVQNLTVEGKGQSVVISWEVPTYGLNEGYLDNSNLMYTVVRYPDGLEVAKDIKELTVTDTNIDKLSCYYYTVQAKSSLGTGDVVQSANVIAGDVYTAPVSLDFSNSLNAELWTVLGSWEWTRGVEDGDERMITLAEDWPENWLISPDIKLEAGKRYKITSIIRTDLGPKCSHDFKFALGMGKTAEDMTIELRDVQGHNIVSTYLVEKYVDYVDITETGNYNYGINVYTINGYDVFSLLGITVEEVLEVDMAVGGIENIFEAVYNTDNTCTVTVRNNGSKDVNNYTLKIARFVEDGNHVVLGEQTEVPAIKAYEEAKVEVTFKPDLEEDMQIVAIVEAEGDGNLSDNVSEPYSIVVLPEGMSTFNRRITNEANQGVFTRVPMSFYTDESICHSIYLSDELLMPNGGKIIRLAYEYEGNEIESILGPFSVKVYMAHTDLVQFKTTDDVIDISTMQLVYDGESTISPGVNKMTFNLQEEFEYDGKKNICVAIVKNGLVGVTFPAFFNIFSDDVENLRTILEDGSPINIEDVPVLQLAVVENTSGIEDVFTVNGKKIWYDTENNTLNFSDSNVLSVSVYDMSGKLVYSSNIASGVNTLNLNLPSGLYVVNAVNEDGLTDRLKISVMR